MKKNFLMWVLLPVLCGIGLTQCTFGTLDGVQLPWEFRSQYAYWDTTYYDNDPNKPGVKVLKERKDVEGGEALVVMLFGFAVDLHRDAATWTSMEKDHVSSGLRTQPVLLFAVSHAEDLKPGDKIEYDSEKAGQYLDASEKALSVGYSPGSGVLSPLDTNPDTLMTMGSKVTATLQLMGIPKVPLPSTIKGTISYKVEKGENDPDDVITGSFNTVFSADVLNERLGECNYATMWYSTYYAYYYQMGWGMDGCNGDRTSGNP